MQPRIESRHYPVISAGIDWLSVRAKDSESVTAIDTLAHHIIKGAQDAGEKVEHSVRLGFGGRSVSGLFYGHKEALSLISLSSDVAQKFGPTLLKLGGSVARIDLQVTICTGSEPFNLASESFYRAKTMPLQGGRPRELKLTTVHPAGDTLNVNKRTSDHYGRIYDYGAAHGTHERHKAWRYVVEFKRGIAKSIASSLAATDDCQSMAEHIVYSWYFPRLPDLFFAPRLSSSPLDLIPAKRERDVLRWFEESLSVSVGRAIKDYGERRVMTALGLSRYLNSDESEVTNDAGFAGHSDAVHSLRKVRKPRNADAVLVPKQAKRRHE